MKLSPLPIYEYIKDYYLFYVPNSTNLYYQSTEIKRLYQLVTNKEAHQAFPSWNNLLSEIKQSCPDYHIYDYKSNRASLTSKIVIPTTDKSSVNAFISISLIGPFYTLFIEQKMNDDTRLYISPFREYEDVFLKLDGLIEKWLPNYVFICSNLLIMNFFNLIVPGLESARSSDGLTNQTITLLQGLFFNYDIRQEGFFARIGDPYYKTTDHFSREYNPEEIAEIKTTLEDGTEILRKLE